jgi:hypothetical protein
MKGNTVPVVGELAVLVERAERACRTTAQLVRDFNFVVAWYQSRPRWRLRADPILDETEGIDETNDQMRTHDSPSDPLDIAGPLDSHWTI